VLTVVNSVASRGVESILVRIEVNVASRGFPSFDIVGLPSKAVAESRERVKTAIINSGFKFPNKKITINLAPADVPKEGSFYDLPIAVGLLANICDFEISQSALYYGELSLDGSLRHTKGVLLAAIFAEEHDYGAIFVPDVNKKEASAIDGVCVYSVKSLSELAKHLSGERKLKVVERVGFDDTCELSEDDIKHDKDYVDFADIIGQEHAKRALEIAAVGNHNVLMMGPPGAGKTMLAKAFRYVLPPLDFEESIEVTRIYSAAGLLGPGDTLISERPFRNPHHTTSFSGMIGGGVNPKPGEISLAHRGVLFMDEFPEFNRRVLESLRQPLEEGSVSIVRSMGCVKYPSKFILIAASNPCPCGYYNVPDCMCNCTQYQVSNYISRISGPMLDRIDMVVRLGRIKTREISSSDNKKTGLETSEMIRKRVREVARLRNEVSVHSDVNLLNKESAKDMNKKYIISKESKQLLTMALDKFNLSMRSYHKTIRLARTIADLGKTEMIEMQHITEALQYRS